MTGIKPLSEQTLMNNYVFAMVMREPKRIKPLLEYILNKKLRSVRMIEPEKTLKETFESKGIRLDLYVEDEDGVIYDVEVQTTKKKSLGKRMRYYQGMLDISVFPSGADYRKIKDSYVIFICSHDPYGLGRYIYTFQNRCDQDNDLLLGDEAVKIVVNTKGTSGDISDELKEAITYLDRGIITGKYSADLDRAVKELINNEERGQEYMLLMAHDAEQRAAGSYAKAVGIIREWNRDTDKIDKSKLAGYIQISIPEFDGILAVINEHPEWDDETIAEYSA